METAKEHLHYVETFGEGPAMMMYFAHILPKLLGGTGAEDRGFATIESAPQEVNDGPPNGDVGAAIVRKFEALAVNMSVLTEALSKAGAPRPNRDLHAKRERVDALARPYVEFGGAKVKPGVIHFHQRLDDDPKSYAVLGHDDSHFHVVPTDNEEGRLEPGWGPGDVKKLSKMPRDVHYFVTRWPVISSDKIASQEKHGHPVYNSSPEQQALVEGLNFSTKPLQERMRTSGVYGSESHWRRAAGGQPLYLKGDPTPSEFPTVRREVAAHNIARDVFGLGHLVTPTALIRDPRTGQEMAAVQKVAGGEHYEHSRGHDNALDTLAERGDLHRAALMDWVLGNYDRHGGNWMLRHDEKSGRPELKLIDHGETFTDSAKDIVEIPDYLHKHHQAISGHDGMDAGDEENQPLHAGAQEWAASLNPGRLVDEMRKHEIPEKYVAAAVRRISFVQQSAASAARARRSMKLGEVFGDLSTSWWDED
jgi:hypothetical protein